MSHYTSDPIFPRDAYAICKLPCDPLSIQRLERNQEREKESASIEDPKNVVLHGSLSFVQTTENTWSQYLEPW